MKVVIFGATGMVGQGVLRQSLLDPRVTGVLTVGRSATGRQDAKLTELTPPDLHDLSPIEEHLTGLDACLFCLGVTSAGMNEAGYRRITYDLTVSAGATLSRLNPGMTFIYVSGQGTDAGSRTMWSRVKGATENALLGMPLEAYMFRPGYIQPVHGEKSKTKLYAAAYVVVKPLYPLLRRAFPRSVTSTEQIGKAMLNVAANGYPERILGPEQINDAAA